MIYVDAYVDAHLIMASIETTHQRIVTMSLGLTIKIYVVIKSPITVLLNLNLNEMNARLYVITHVGIYY
jgi:hypothetical protein